MKNKQERQEEAKKRQEEYDSLTSKQKYLKLDLALGQFSGAKKQRRKLELEILSEPIQTSQIPSGTGDSINKEKKKYQKPKKS